MKVFFDDQHCREHLIPFTQLRHSSEIRIGILTIRQKWERLLANDAQFFSTEMPGAIRIPANIIPTHHNYKAIIDACLKGDDLSGNLNVVSLKFPWHIFQFNDHAIREDYFILIRNRNSQVLSRTNTFINEPNIFIEEGASIEYSHLNASGGPIYIGRNATVMEGCLIRGPFALCDEATLKMGSKIYGATTIGPHCVAGGEIKNSVLMGYSNKSHEGYLGDSVIGEWCNLGAGTSNSNVKNTASHVSFTLKNEVFDTGNIKGGLIMGDYSRSAINTSFYTGTVVGICCNIFGPEFPGKYVPDFSWGNERYALEKAFRDIENWKRLKGFGLTNTEKETLSKIYRNI
jgi:UDP-N-acetylglucosamine diphosphorylase / glucose-1-phosphate thymidylyltransferase / UDP-N-acetylgalactosamine diphosphorylase / glucosamine-1-phosphate N-acetyltransferase / galactosamine-1-phosphate N-acetyltransferase